MNSVSIPIHYTNPSYRGIFLEEDDPPYWKEAVSEFPNRSVLLWRIIQLLVISLIN